MYLHLWWVVGGKDGEGSGLVVGVSHGSVARPFVGEGPSAWVGWDVALRAGKWLIVGWGLMAVVVSRGGASLAKGYM